MAQILVITGPTATGKTALAIQAAGLLEGEIVSADSMQLYRGMDIGTAKPTPAERQGVVHHMLDVADPRDNFSAARYAQMAGACVEDILRRGKTPLVVGGTGLYIDALVRGRDFACAPYDPAVRQRAEEEYDLLGGEAFRSRLASVDPVRAARLHPRDRKRLVRAWEVYVLTGESLTALDERSRTQPPRFQAVTVALDYAQRDTLYARIDRRTADMFRRGLVEEVQTLLQSGVDRQCTAMQAIGYKEVAAALHDGISLAQAQQQVAQASRRYAKRQLTWLRSRKEVHWLRWQKEPDGACLALAARLVADIFWNRPRGAIPPDAGFSGL